MTEQECVEVELGKIEAQYAISPDDKEGILARLEQEPATARVLQMLPGELKRKFQEYSGLSLVIVGEVIRIQFDPHCGSDQEYRDKMGGFLENWFFPAANAGLRRLEIGVLVSEGTFQRAACIE